LIKRHLPDNYKIHNEYSLNTTRGSVDIVILDETNSPQYMIEFKNHGEQIPYELRNKIFRDKEKIDLFLKEMKKMLQSYDDLPKNKVLALSPRDNSGKSIFSPQFVEKILEIYSQYNRMINFIQYNPRVKGFMFFNDWNSHLNDYTLKKYSLDRDDFNNCLNIRRDIIAQLLNINKHKKTVVFKYFNLLT
jgi:hypothetical protein